MMARAPQFLNAPEDCEWLRDTALRSFPDAPPFQSFTIEGNEDAPERVTLYTSADPLYTDKPAAEYVQDPETGDLTRE
jgi:hypothetical protein